MPNKKYAKKAQKKSAKKALKKTSKKIEPLTGHAKKIQNKLSKAAQILSDPIFNVSKHMSDIKAVRALTTLYVPFCNTVNKIIDKTGTDYNTAWDKADDHEDRTGHSVTVIGSE